MCLRQRKVALVDPEASESRHSFRGAALRLHNNSFGIAYDDEELS